MATKTSSQANEFSVAITGPLAFMGAGLLAVVNTVTAATVAPGLAHKGDREYLVSGVVMCLSDLLVLIGVIALWRTPAVRRGWLKTWAS